ncbi:MAG TPA: anti-sigma factor [Jatrophihabitans sp.]|nr:anti-sigma factor [Jatrophihabitans sp.]
MPLPTDPHDPRYELDRQDNLALMALGETVDPGFAEHQSSCPICRAELAELTATVQLARASSREVVEATPPPSVWQAIEAEVAGVPSLSRRGRRWRAARWQLGLIAAVLVLSVGLGGYLLGRDTSPQARSVAASAALVQQPGGPKNVSGSAVVVHTTAGYSLTVTTHSLPYRSGYYAVWVYDPKINHMINVGALDAAGSGQFVLPPGVDIRDYDVVDVSAQDFDGSPVHKQSVLQGPLTI